MSRSISGALSVILSTTLLLSACSSSDDDKPSAGSSGTTPAAGESASEDPSLPSFEAPREFGGDPVPITLGALNANLAGEFTSRFTLADDRAYGVTGTGVGAVDLTSGETLWETRFPNAPDDDTGGPFYDSRGPGAPAVSEDGSTVYAALVVEIPGSGTTADSFAAQLIAVDAESGDLAWSADIPAGPEVYRTSAESVYVAAAEDGRVVVTRPGDGIVTDGLVAAVDTISHEVLWSRPGSVRAVTPEAVVVIAETDKEGDANYPQLTGLDPSTGEVLWTSGDDSDSAVSGASMIETEMGLVVTVTPYGGADPHTDVLDPTTGRVTQPLPDVALSSPVEDGEVLYDVTGDGVRALDPGTLAVIWELPEGNRIAPGSPVFFGGLVYGRVGDGMSVVLDGTTGADITADIPGSFVDVNEHGALMLRDEEIVFVPATG
jgi:outer membrane protein assembly factor BamB